MGLTTLIEKSKKSMKETVALPATKLRLIEAGKEEINKKSEISNFK